MAFTARTTPLSHMLGISETDAPLLFRSGCAPVDQDAFKKKFNTQRLLRSDALFVSSSMA